MITKAGKKAIRYIECGIEPEYLMTKVDPKNTDEDQWLDFLAVAQRKAQKIEMKINNLFEHIR